MNDIGPHNSNNPKPSNNSFNPLFDLLIVLAKGLRNQTFIFVLAMGALIITAFLISQKIGSFVPLYVIVGSLVVLTLMALWAESISNTKTLHIPLNDKSKISRNKGEKMDRSTNMAKAPMSQFDKLLGCLNKLADTEFRELIYSLLTPQEINHLPRPVDIIDRGAFLGQMKMYDRLGDVENFLYQKYPDRCAK